MYRSIPDSFWESSATICNAPVDTHAAMWASLRDRVWLQRRNDLPDGKHPEQPAATQTLRGIDPYPTCHEDGEGEKRGESLVEAHQEGDTAGHYKHRRYATSTRN